MEKFNYVYVTTNLINGKQYVGSHFGEEDDSYLGSGKPLFKNAVKKYGKENFKKEVIEKCKPEDNLLLETKYIEKINTLQPNGYNISLTGGTRNGGRHSEETKRKISKANKGKVSWSKGKICPQLAGANNGMYGQPGPCLGRKLTNKEKEHLQQLYKGKTYEEIHGLEKASKIKKQMSLDRIGAGNSFYNKKHNIETRKKISNSKRKHFPKEEEVNEIKKLKLTCKYKEISELYPEYLNILRHIVAGRYDKYYEA